LKKKSKKIKNHLKNKEPQLKEKKIKRQLWILTGSTWISRGEDKKDGEEKKI
jgi:hypothetical protein